MDLKTPIFLLLITLYSVSGKKERIRLQDVETLTLYSDKWTTARRSAPVKQLNCVGGSCYRASIATAQCYNRGFDGNDVQWECKAEFPSNYKFGRLEVTCEGYEYPEDDYILTGSCGLEYTVVEVSKSSDSYFPSYTNMKSRDDDGAGSSMLTILVVFGAAIALYFYLKPSNEGQRQQSASGRSSYNTNPSAPPPPGFRPDFYGTNMAWQLEVFSVTCSDHRIGAIMAMADIILTIGHTITLHLHQVILLTEDQVLLAVTTAAPQHQLRLVSLQRKDDSLPEIF
ncbi:Store-operated calcium entry-associated regulatory factor, partial [Pseudolycoriella hygida]